MRVNFKTDAPLAGDYGRFMKRDILIRHRNDVMGELAAQLNVLLDGVPEKSIRQIWRMPHTVGLRGPVFNAQLRQAAEGYLAHQLYFNRLQESGDPTCPVGATAARIRQSFGSTERFAYAFRQAARTAPVGGFLWLCEVKRRRGGAYLLTATVRHQMPDARLTPVLALDLWEHAYLEAFGRDVGKYAAAYLAAVDWSKIP